MIYFYGGAFDPFTNAHESIIKSIIKHENNDDRVFIGIANNDEKDYHTTIDERFDVVNKALKNKFKENTPTVVEQQLRTYLFLGEHFYGQNEEICIVVGEDEWNALIDGKWINYNNLLKEYKFLVVRRSGYEDDNTTDIRMPKNITPNVKVVCADNTIDVSSSIVREIFYRNPFTHYKDVKQYISRSTYEAIKENELYMQNPLDYDQKENEFVKKYQIDKEKNGWPEPSNTVDVLAYNGNKILLIRRGNYPYKNAWCLPGGFMEKTDIDLRFTAFRELHEETNLEINPERFKQIKTYSHNFDPRMKIVDTAFEVRVSSRDMKLTKGGDDAADACWFEINNLPLLGFHHQMIIDDWKKKHAGYDYL